MGEIRFNPAGLTSHFKVESVQKKAKKYGSRKWNGSRKKIP